MADIKIRERETLSDNKYRLEMIKASFTGSDGKTIETRNEIYHRPPATTILLYDKERKTILLTRQVRIATLDNNPGGMLTEACAGIIDEGELPEQTIVREVEEETGYRISEIQKIYEAFSSPAGTTEVIHYYIGKYNRDMKVTKGGGVDKGEDVALTEWTFDEARQRLNSGEIRDIKTIVLLQYAMLNALI